jgi:hypothetical protein
MFLDAFSDCGSENRLKRQEIKKGEKTTNIRKEE